MALSGTILLIKREIMALCGLTIGFRNIYTSHCGTEKHYHRVATSVEAALVDAIVLVRLRAQMLGGGAHIFKSWLSMDSDNFTDSLDVPRPLIPSGTSPYNEDLDNATLMGGKGLHDYAYANVLCRKISTSRNKANMYLMFAPDIAQSVNQQTIIAVPFTDAFAEWRNELIAHWNYKGLDTDPNLVRQITAIDSTGNFIITAPAHGLQSGDMATVKGLSPRENAPNGIFQVTRLTADTVSLQGTLDHPAYVYQRGGKIIKRQYTSYPLTAVKQIRFTHRDRGSSLGNFRGRQRT